MEQWAVAIPGPDEVWPMASRQIAEETAKQHNERLVVERVAERWGVEYSDLEAKVILWPDSEVAYLRLLEIGEPLYLYEI